MMKLKISAHIYDSGWLIDRSQNISIVTVITMETTNPLHQRAPHFSLNSVKELILIVPMLVFEVNYDIHHHQHL
jgi:hypothetical protein